MKIDKQFSRILVVAFFAPLIRQIVNAALERNIPYMVGIENLYTVLLIEDLIIVNSLVITPLLTFALFYYLGKRPYLTFQMRSILLALLIGGIASLVVGPIVYSAIGSIGLGIGIILQYTLPYFVVDYITALAGLSIGYIKQKKLLLLDEPELN